MRNDSDEWLLIHSRLNALLLRVEATHNQNVICKHRAQLNTIIIKVNEYTIYEHALFKTNNAYVERQHNIAVEIQQDIKTFEDEMLLAYLRYVP
jgi:PHD/YefM family antitoxin component YafN of YafNO toxin-antitoxin module